MAFVILNLTMRGITVSFWFHSGVTRHIFAMSNAVGWFHMRISWGIMNNAVYNFRLRSCDPWHPCDGDGGVSGVTCAFRTPGFATTSIPTRTLSGCGPVFFLFSPEGSSGSLRPVDCPSLDTNDNADCGTCTANKSLCTENGISSSSQFPSQLHPPFPKEKICLNKKKKKNDREKRLC